MKSKFSITNHTTTTVKINVPLKPESQLIKQKVRSLAIQLGDELSKKTLKNQSVQVVSKRQRIYKTTVQYHRPHLR